MTVIIGSLVFGWIELADHTTLPILLPKSDIGGVAGEILRSRTGLVTCRNSGGAEGI